MDKNIDKKYNCVLCKKECVGYGHNPAPLSQTGRCCDSCNADVIIERIQIMGLNVGDKKQLKKLLSFNLVN